MLHGHAKEVCRVAFSPDGRYIVTGAVDGTLNFWNAVTGKKGLPLGKHTDYVSCLEFSPDATHILSGSLHQLKLWDATAVQEAMMLEGHIQLSHTCATFSPDGKQIVSWLF